MFSNTSKSQLLSALARGTTQSLGLSASGRTQMKEANRGIPSGVSSYDPPHPNIIEGFISKVVLLHVLND